MASRKLSWLVVAGVAAVLTVGVAAEQPPANLHQVGDHWTAWDPPSAFPEGTEVHIIEPGDTLWGLSGRFYGDPYLWPQLWERNQYIQDAHWIYPGDPLVTSVAVAPADTLSEIEVEEPMVAEPAADGEGELLLSYEARPPVPLGYEDDLYCSGYIGEPDEAFDIRISGTEYEAMSPVLAGIAERGKGLYGSGDSVKYNLYTGDIVYLDQGTEGGVAPGSLYTVVGPGEMIDHPMTRKPAGRLYHHQARLRVLTAQPTTSIAEIVHSCEPVHVGSALKPFEPEPVPLGRKQEMRPPNFPPEVDAESPVILYAKDGLFSVAEDHVVYIDHGAEEDIAPGDLFTIYRPNPLGHVPIVLGELAVLSVRDHSAIAKIIGTRFPVYVGDRLVRK